MSPLEISILLHYHMSAEDYPGAVLSAGERASGRAPGPAIRNAVDRFVRAGLLIDTHRFQPSAPSVPPCPGIPLPIPGAQPEPYQLPKPPTEAPTMPARYKAGEGLVLYVQALQRVPLPVLRWMMPGEAAGPVKVPEF